MRLFDFLFEEVADKPAAAPASAGPARHRAPVLNVVLDNTESGRTVSWGEDGLELSGIKARFPAKAATGGTVLEGVKFIGSFSAVVTAQTADRLCLSFTQTDK